jgi:hypothetical protein
MAVSQQECFAGLFVVCPLLHKLMERARNAGKYLRRMFMHGMTQKGQTKEKFKLLSVFSTSPGFFKGLDIAPHPNREPPVGLPQRRRSLPGVRRDDLRPAPRQCGGQPV